MPIFTFDMFLNEVKYGGPHVHLIEFLLCLAISILIIHYIFKGLIFLICKNKHISEHILKRTFNGLAPCIGILLGISFIEYFITIPDFVKKHIDLLFHIVLTFTITLFIAHLCSEWIKYKMGRTSKQMGSTSILATAVDCAVYAIGALIFLESYGISISPLLTALGVGGLASALALQDTLNNLFTGITTLVSKQIRIGDYVKLSSGEEGRVVDMNWRNTTINTPTNNMIIVPNKNFGASTLTNYEQPYAECTILIPLTVTYGSDLNKVEETTLEVARYVLQKSEYGVSGFEPKVQFSSLGDYGISFNVVLRLRNVIDQASLKHQFIKRIYQKYEEKDIQLLIRHD